MFFKKVVFFFPKRVTLLFQNLSGYLLYGQEVL